MTWRIRMYAARVRDFAGLVGRPVTGPVAGERWPWRRWLRMLLTPAEAWWLACGLHTARDYRPAKEAEA
jgi:hypothetical protein